MYTNKENQKNKSYPRGYSNDELIKLIDQYGNSSVNNTTGSSYFLKATLGLFELHERENTKIAKHSSYVAFLALIISCIGLYFSIIQTRPILDEYTKEERSSLAYCLENIDGYRDKKDGSTTTCRAILKNNGYKFKSEISDYSAVFENVFDFGNPNQIFPKTSSQNLYILDDTQ